MNEDEWKFKIKMMKAEIKKYKSLNNALKNIIKHNDLVERALIKKLKNYEKEK